MTGQSMRTEGREPCLNSDVERLMSNIARHTERFGPYLYVMWEPLEDVEKMSLERHGCVQEGFKQTKEGGGGSH